MKMNDYIAEYSNHLNVAMNIGESTVLVKRKRKITTVLIVGLGGSGIGGSILIDIIGQQISVPILATKDYSVPGFVNKNTLVIASSYSGNTEETIYAIKKCQKMGAEIAIISSGGELISIAKEKKHNNIVVPSGHPPRAMFGYTFPQLFYILHHYEIISSGFKADFKKAILMLSSEKNNIKDLALNLAKNLYKKTPVIYAANGFEGVSIRFRQQINENSKMLCWHHVVPEMNHNELLGWRTNVENLAVVYIRNKSDYERNQIRIGINKKIIKKYTANITEVWSEGESLIENSLYHINLGDWVSWYLSEMNNVDAIEIDVINFLKNELAKV